MAITIRGMQGMEEKGTHAVNSIFSRYVGWAKSKVERVLACIIVQCHQSVRVSISVALSE